MNYWIFIATQHKSSGGSLSGDDIVKQRGQDRFWGLGEKTPNRKALRKGDLAVRPESSRAKRARGATSAADCNRVCSSNHTNGIAMDFSTTEEKLGELGPSKAQKSLWQKSWFYEWLTKNAGTYHFVQLPSEEWHWDHKP